MVSNTTKNEAITLNPTTSQMFLLLEYPILFPTLRYTNVPTPAESISEVNKLDILLFKTLILKPLSVVHLTLVYKKVWRETQMC